MPPLPDADADHDARTFPHTITVWGYQERWLAEMGLVQGGEGAGGKKRGAGAKKERGGLSGFIQALIDQARIGKIDTTALLQGHKSPPGSLERAALYMKAKEASMMFEEDVCNVVSGAIAMRRNLRVVRSRIHKTDRNLFVADVSVETRDGAVQASIQCKSSPRIDRLQLALAEAQIGATVTGKPVITVCPYFIEESARALKGFATLKHPCVELDGLRAALEAALR